MERTHARKLKFEQAHPDDWDAFNGWPAMPTTVTRAEAASGAAACDADGGEAGYGWVLDDGTARGPYQNVIQWFDANNNPHDLNGSFTLWVRPRLIQDMDGGLQEDTDTLVLTAEGTAPYVVDPTNLGDPVSGRFVRSHRAVQVLEVVLSRLSTPRCNKDESQAGGDAAGSGMKACDPIPNELKGYGGGGTGQEINKTTR